MLEILKSNTYSEQVVNYSKCGMLPSLNFYFGTDMTYTI